MRPAPSRCSAGYAGAVKPLPAEDLEHVLRHTESLWNEARGASLFITGGTGFFGAWLLESLLFCNRVLKLNISATVLSRDPYAFAGRMPHLAGDPAIRVVEGDVRTFSFPPDDFDYVIHGATSTSADAASRPAELLDTIVHGTEHVIDLARRSNTKSFLFASTGAVYGSQPETMSHIPESYHGGPDWLDPASAYAEGKRVAEQICSIAARDSGMRFALARGFALVGPRLPLDEHLAIGNFIADALAGRNISIKGDGTPVRSYLYAADLAIWLWTLLFRRAPSGENPLVLNIGSDEEISIHDLARLVVHELKPSLRVEVAGQSALGERRHRYIPDIGKAETVLGLRPLISLAEAIRRTAAWYR